MKDLGKTIDRLIQIDENFEKALKPIKNKWKRYPKKVENYWDELLAFLNSDDLKTHPKREKMGIVINGPVHRKRPNYSFEVISTKDGIIGPVTGHLADKVRRLDLKSISLAKKRVEANMTHNLTMQIDVLRQEQLLDIDTKKVWVSLRDHFNLWNKPGNYNLKVSSENNILYLINQIEPPRIVGPGVIKMDPEMLKKFLSYMGLEPPPPPNFFGDKK